MMIRLHLALTFLLISLLLLQGCSGSPPQPVTTLDLIEIKSSVSSGRLLRIETFQSEYVEPRTVDIWLPDGVQLKSEGRSSIPDTVNPTSSTRPLRVLYMHDGQMLFDSTKTWNKQEWKVDETVTDLMAAGDVDPMAVVAVWNNGHKRWAEYAPQAAFTPLNIGDPIPGRQNTLKEEVVSDLYVRFLTEELVPFVDKMLDTQPTPDGRGIMGSSMGALISLYAHFERPDIFGRAGAISTHWPVSSPEMFTSPENNPLFRSFYSYISHKISSDQEVRRIYFDYGNQTLDAYYPPYQEEIDRMMKDHALENTEWATYFDDGAAHDERSWANRLDKAILYVMGNQEPVQK